MPTYSQDEPFRQDLDLLIGDTWSLVVTLQDDDGTAFDLTDVTGTAKVRPEPQGEALATPAVTITDAAAGQFTATIAAATTATLQPGDYRYAVRLTWPDGSVYTVIEGRLTARRSLV